MAVVVVVVETVAVLTVTGCGGGSFHAFFRVVLVCSLFDCSFFSAFLLFIFLLLLLIQSLAAAAAADVYLVNRAKRSSGNVHGSSSNSSHSTYGSDQQQTISYGAWQFSINTGETPNKWSVMNVRFV